MNIDINDDTSEKIVYDDIVAPIVRNDMIVPIIYDDNIETRTLDDLTEFKHYGKIYTLSDIHGDLYSFIIALRDCAKVIRKNKIIDLTKIDDEIENNLKIDISDNDNGYEELLGYEWCGGNSYVVICGDILDPNRSDGCKRDDGHLCSEYPQIEIKLLRFINHLNKKANEQNGRIIKLLGNHELMNIMTASINRDYIYKSHDESENYYRGSMRFNIFNVGKIGFNLLFEDGCYILIKINNTIFVHGQLPKNNISEIKVTNDFMNDFDENHPPQSPHGMPIHIYQKLWDTELEKYSLKDSLLWNREWAYPTKIDQRETTNIQKNYCTESIRKDLITFMGNPDVDNLRVILGHCPQNTSSIRNLTNTTITHKISEDCFSKTYSSQTFYTGQINESNQDTIFGITMQCPKPIKNGYVDFYVYHVDVGSSRGFDSIDSYTSITESETDSVNRENKYLFSKTPQILLIEQTVDGDIINIIKSKMKNTRVHLPRPNYENLIKTRNITGLKLDSGNYDKKYLKYKKKYMQLKSNFSQFR